MTARHIAEKSFSFFWKSSKRKLGRALLFLNLRSKSEVLQEKVIDVDLERF